MKVQVAYHGVDHSQALDFFVKEKLDRAKKLFSRASDVDCVVARDGNNYSFSLYYKGHGLDEHVRAKGNSVHRSVSEGVHKLKNRLRDFKSKKHSHR